MLLSPTNTLALDYTQMKSRVDDLVGKCCVNIEILFIFYVND